uniref:SMP-30/Gluconolactonase/LRE-like region domain-containing protein n=1 Tax=Eutreptiella gymnastica TaxID=73025 RepID=A0A7S1J9G4_9EUGL|mmetsp:Transcript_76244/g.134562  ORF Transcript_76244/g.134562 Transcript_76244/m.134562 type:complete len:281 (+) Transcript_76244:77-919(+)
MPLEKVVEGAGSVTSPTFDKHGVLHVCCTQTGAVHKIVDGELVEVLNTQGQPSTIVFDPNLGTLYVCDLAHQAILRVEEEDQSAGQAPVLAEFVTEYEGRLLRGPTGMVFDAAGNMYFCDSGPMGDTTLGNPKASVYNIACDASLLQPLAADCLAHATGLCLSPNGQTLYVCETMNNRILRFAQRPNGVWHMSVYHNFSGGVGPMSCAADNSRALYVARYDFRGQSSEGIISILLPNGQLHAELAIPGAEVTGLCFDEECKFLYITEASAGAIYRYNLKE